MLENMSSVRFRHLKLLRNKEKTFAPNPYNFNILSNPIGSTVMGLVIQAYSKLKLEKPLTDEEMEEFWENFDEEDEDAVEEFLETHVVVDTYPEFPHQAEGLVQGIYKRLEGSEEFEVESMGYSGYNNWRTQLWQLANDVDEDIISENPDEWKDKPFFLLVHFPDCEGTISTAACAKLHAQFVEYREKAEELDDPGFLETYDEIMEALELAKDDGVLIFG